MLMKQLYHEIQGLFEIKALIEGLLSVGTGTWRPTLPCLIVDLMDTYSCRHKLHSPQC